MIARRERTFERQLFEHIRVDQFGERPQLIHTQLREIDTLLRSAAHCARDDFVGFAERHAFFHQIVGEIGRRGIALRRGATHRLFVDADATNHVSVDPQGRTQGVHGVKQRFLVFLVVLVVGERLTLHERQKPHQMAIDAPGLAADEFRHIRIFLLRHHRRAGAKPVGQPDEAEAGIHPQDQLFGKPGQVRHDQRRTGAKLDRKVPIGHRVERVLADAVEAELLCNTFPIDRECRSGKRAGAQRQLIEPLAAIGQSRCVTPEHLVIGHQVMGETHRLCDLQMRETGHQRIDMLVREIKQAALECDHERERLVDGGTQVKPDVGGHLVIARAAGVQPFARVAHQIGQAFLDVKVDIFEIDRPGEFSLPDFIEDARHAAFDVGKVVFGQYTDRMQHACMRERTLNVEFSQPLVEADGRRIAFDQFRDRFVESARPRLAVLVCRRFLLLHWRSAPFTMECVKQLFWRAFQHVFRDGKYKSKPRCDPAAEFPQSWSHAAGAGHRYGTDCRCGDAEIVELEQPSAAVGRHRSRGTADCDPFGGAARCSEFVAAQD